MVRSIVPEVSTTVLHLVEDGETYEIHVRRPLIHYSKPLNEKVYLEMHYPLWRHGWVFQERLLAPRVLQFWQCELFWECAEAAEGECCGRPARDRENFQGIFFPARNYRGRSARIIFI
jgi:hypothetical protein